MQKKQRNKVTKIYAVTLVIFFFKLNEFIIVWMSSMCYPCWSNFYVLIIISPLKIKCRQSRKKWSYRTKESKSFGKTYVFICCSLHWFYYLSIHSSVSLSVHLFVCLPVCLPIYWYDSVCMPIWLSAYLFDCQSLGLPISLAVCSSAFCPSTHWFSYTGDGYVRAL